MTGAIRVLVADDHIPTRTGVRLALENRGFEVCAEAGDAAEAIEAATRAYELAWCDGPPFAYHWGLQAAKAHLQALGAPEPPMPPFDESNYEPMPEVEIDPPDAPEDEEPA